MCAGLFTVQWSKKKHSHTSFSSVRFLLDVPAWDITADMRCTLCATNDVTYPPAEADMQMSQDAMSGALFMLFITWYVTGNTQDLVADRCNFSTAARGNRSCDEDGKRPDSSLWYRFTLARLLKMSSADNLLHPSAKMQNTIFPQKHEASADWHRRDGRIRRSGGYFYTDNVS